MRCSLFANKDSCSSAKMALVNRQMLNHFDTALIAKHDLLGYQDEIREAISAIDKCLRTLMELELASFLPITMSAYSP